MVGLTRVGLTMVPIGFLALVAAEHGGAGTFAAPRREAMAIGLGALGGAALAIALLHAFLPRTLGEPDAVRASGLPGRNLLRALGAGLVAGWLLGPALFGLKDPRVAGIATVAVLFAAGALLALAEAARQLAAGKPLRFESHWGGLGGGGGWELSAPLGLILLGLLLAAASLGALQALPAPPPPRTPPAASAANPTTTVTTTTTTSGAAGASAPARPPGN